MLKKYKKSLEPVFLSHFLVFTFIQRLHLPKVVVVSVYEEHLNKNHISYFVIYFYLFIFIFKGGTKCHRSTHSTHALLTLCTQNSTNATHENQHL
jgi:hypothetical protein